MKLQVAINAPSSVLQTIVQYPGATYFTSPFSSTLQTASLDDDHVTFLLTPLPEGLTVGGSLDLEYTDIKVLPDSLSVGGGLY